MEKCNLLLKFLPSDEKKTYEEILKQPFSSSKIQVFKGRKIIPDFNAAAMEYICNEWNAKSSDVFIASYPKTGKVLPILVCNSNICIFSFLNLKTLL